MVLDNKGGYLTHYFYAYITGPLLGGLLAGVFSRFHNPLHAEEAKKGLPANQDEEQNSLMRYAEAQGAEVVV